MIMDEVIARFMLSGLSENDAIMLVAKFLESEAEVYVEAMKQVR